MAGNKRSMLRAVAPAGGGGLDSAAMSMAECFSSIIGSALVLHVWGLACDARLCLRSSSPSRRMA
eukprot:1612017-Alexandrium_andersonii.AAC.1